MKRIGDDLPDNCNKEILAISTHPSYGACGVVLGGKRNVGMCLLNALIMTGMIFNGEFFNPWYWLAMFIISFASRGRQCFLLQTMTFGNQTTTPHYNQ